MRVLLAGLGSIGRRHLANMRALEPEAEIAVLRHSMDDPQVPAGADRVMFSLADALAFAPAIALVCGPSSTHVATALPLARAGVHVFIEKPLAADRAGVDELLEMCAERGVALGVGYNLRYLPSLKCLRDAVVSGSIGRLMTLRAEVGQYLPDWRPTIDYRRSASAQIDGGGALLELSHEIDYLCWIAGDVLDVTAITGKLSDLELAVEDTAELMLRFESGCFSSVHLDMTQHAAVRQCRAVGTEGTLTWDGLSGIVRRYSADSRAWHTIFAGDQDRNEMYVDQLRAFISASRGEGQEIVRGDEGVRVLDIVTAAKRSAREGRTIVIAASGVPR